MKVLFDHQIFTIQKYGGVSKYFFELLRRFPKENWELPIIFSNNEYIKNSDLVNYYSFFPKTKIPGKATIMCNINKLKTTNKIIQGDFDVFHQTHYQTYSIPLLKDKPFVTTFHDMNFHRFGHADLSIQKKSISRADKIIAVSQNTKNELIETWKIPESKVEVIHHGVDTPLDKELIGERVIQDRYILYIGLRKGFKNFNRFIKAFSVVSKQIPDLKLVCTGSAFTKDERQQFDELKIQNKVIQISASEVVMANLYTFAELFVYPSLYEGFGMPILEAMSYGCPTLISNASCFPEIAKDASFYFNPEDTEEMASNMVELLNDEKKRVSKTENACRLCEEYTWEKTLEKHINVYKMLL